MQVSFPNSDSIWEIPGCIENLKTFSLQTFLFKYSSQSFLIILNVENYIKKYIFFNKIILYCKLNHLIQIPANWLSKYIIIIKQIKWFGYFSSLKTRSNESIWPPDEKFDWKRANKQKVGFRWRRIEFWPGIGVLLVDHWYY